MNDLTCRIKEALDACQLAPDSALLNHGFSQPAVDFEKKHGLGGISQSYALPEGHSAEALQTYLLLLREMTGKGILSVEQRIGKMTDILHTLVALNPDLEKIRYNPDSAETLYHAVMGIASAFNTNDIQHFIDSRARDEKPATIMWESPKYKKLTAAFNKSAGRTAAEFGLFWVASPATLDLIHKQFRKKTAAAAPKPKNTPPAISP